VKSINCKRWTPQPHRCDDADVTSVLIDALSISRGNHRSIQVRIDSRDSWTCNGRHGARSESARGSSINPQDPPRAGPLARPVINSNYYYPRGPPAIRYPAAAATAFCFLSLSLSLSLSLFSCRCAKFLQPVVVIFYSRKKHWTSSTLARPYFMIQFDFAEDFRPREIKSTVAKWVVIHFAMNVIEWSMD